MEKKNNAIYASSDILARAQTVVDTDIRSLLQAHGGDIRLLRETDGVLYFELSGSCSGCPSAWLTVEEIVREPLMSAIPELTDVIVENTVDEGLLQLARDVLSGKKVFS